MGGLFPVGQVGLVHSPPSLTCEQQSSMAADWECRLSRVFWIVGFLMETRKNDFVCVSDSSKP